MVTGVAARVVGTVILIVVTMGLWSYVVALSAAKDDLSALVGLVGPWALWAAVGLVLVLVWRAPMKALKTKVSALLKEDRE